MLRAISTEVLVKLRERYLSGRTRFLQGREEGRANYALFLTQL
jgi:hypothetical protein